MLHRQVATCTFPLTMWDEHRSVQPSDAVRMIQYMMIVPILSAFISNLTQVGYQQGRTMLCSLSLTSQNHDHTPFDFIPLNKAVGMCFPQNVLLFVESFFSLLTFVVQCFVQVQSHLSFLIRVVQNVFLHQLAMWTAASYSPLSAVWFWAGSIQDLLETECMIVVWLTQTRKL